MDSRLRGNDKFWLIVFGIVLLFLSPAIALAQNDGSADTGSLKQDVDQLNAEVREKQERIKEVDGLIAKYKSSIAARETQVASLQNDIALMDNRIQEKELSLERVKDQIDITNLQIQSLGREIALDQKTLTVRREALGELVRKVHEGDGVGALYVLLTRPSLSAFFSRLEELKRVEEDLAGATSKLHEVQDRLVEKKKQSELERNRLQDEKRDVQKAQAALAAERGAKVSLVTESKNKEEEFQRILYELHQEQQMTADRIADLQDKLKDRLDTIDASLARGDVLLSWPIRPEKGVSAGFHDPTYPFRYLFEHPGTDIPTDVGTPVRAAAGGYVAWNRTGRQYGNYVMLIHPGGIATVYAHLSKFAAKPDSYVERGEVIGYSGGRPGDEGAGLSTGPHLHFEVRQNGIPVNAEQFLPSLD